MTSRAFRRTALGMRGASESAHMGHPDFRVNGRIFASLDADEAQGTIKLTPEEQARVLAGHAGMFEPASGAWGRQGWTRVRLDAIDEETLGEAITRAWQLVAEAPPARSSRRRMPGRRPVRARPRR